jgi:cellobiose transport system permease protein
MSTVTQVGVATKGAERSAARSTGKRGNKIRKYLPRYLSIAPYYILFLAFGVIPTVFSFYLALQKWDGIGRMQFTGFSNFAYVFTDSTFGLALFNTFAIWFMSNVPMLFIALILAFLINHRKRSKFLYQLAYYIPNVTSVVAITMVFGSFFGEQYGLLNQVLNALHLPAINWLSDAWPMRWAISLIYMWRWTGYNALIFMAGLQSIPIEYYEAARIDGANTIHTFFHVTIPLLRPIILFTVISSTIGGLTLFTEPQVLFGLNGGNSAVGIGGVGNAGLTVLLYQYWQTFSEYHYGYGAAIGWVVFVITVAFTAVNWRIIQRGER